MCSSSTKWFHAHHTARGPCSPPAAPSPRGWAPGLCYFFIPTVPDTVPHTEERVRSVNVTKNKCTIPPLRSESWVTGRKKEGRRGKESAHSKRCRDKILPKDTYVCTQIPAPTTVLRISVQLAATHLCRPLWRSREDIVCVFST